MSHMDIDPEKPLYLNSSRRAMGEQFPEIAPLLTCGHYGKPRDVRSSVWDFLDEAWTCPECKQERQIDLRLQLLMNSEDGWSYLT